MKNNKRQKGFIALTSITIMSAFFVILFTGMFFTATEEMRRTESTYNSIDALSLSNSCAEEALNYLKNDYDYSGGHLVSVGGQDCEVLNVEGHDEIRLIKTTATVDNRTKKVQVEVDVGRHPELTILDWREVSRFTDM